MKIRINKTILTIIIMFIVFWANAVEANAEEKEEYVLPEDAVLVEYKDLGDGLELYVYLDCTDNNNSRTVRARSCNKVYRFRLAGEDAVVVSCTGSFSYGHSDGIARATTVSYTVNKVDPYWGCSVGGFSTSKKDGNPATAAVYFYVMYNGDRYDASNIIYCDNNGTCY